MERRKIKIGFYYSDPSCSNECKSCTEFTVYDEVESELDTLGSYFDRFLSQCGYTRKGGHILTSSITEEELDLLKDYLHKIRTERGES